MTGERPSSAKRVLLDEIGHLRVRADLTVDACPLPFSKDGDQRILGQLAVFVVFICRTELLNEAGDTVGVAIAASSQPYTAALVDTPDLAVGADS